jgi:hypothetical protein
LTATLTATSVDEGVAEEFLDDDEFDAAVRRCSARE